MNHCPSTYPRRSAAALALLGALTPAALAQLEFSIRTLVRDGDNVPGVGSVTRIDSVAVNNHGDWFVQVDTNNPDTTRDQVLLRNRDLFRREGAALPDPPGAILSAFDALALNNNGAFATTVSFFTGDPSTDTGVLFYPDDDPLNEVLTWQEGDPAPGFSPKTPLIGFLDLKLNDGNQLAVVATVEDSLIPTGDDRALYRLQLNSAGSVTSSTVVAVEGTILPGQVEAITDFGFGPHETAIDRDGTILFSVTLTGPVAGNAAIYANDALLAQRGAPSPIPDRNWSALAGARLDLSLGGHTYLGVLDGPIASNSVIIRNSAKLVQEGDALPPPNAAFSVTSFGFGPVLIADAGEVLWYGASNNPDPTRDEALFRDHFLLVQEGVTRVSNLPIVALRGQQNGYAMSDSGRYVIFEAVLDNGLGGIEGAFLITINRPGDANCDGLIDFFDVDPFLQAVFDPAAYTVALPFCDVQSADTNDDDVVNFFDMDSFLALLFP